MKDKILMNRRKPNAMVLIRIFLSSNSFACIISSVLKPTTRKSWRFSAFKFLLKSDLCCMKRSLLCWLCMECFGGRERKSVLCTIIYSVLFNFASSNEKSKLIQKLPLPLFISHAGELTGIICPIMAELLEIRTSPRSLASAINSTSSCKA